MVYPIDASTSDSPALLRSSQTLLLDSNSEEPSIRDIQTTNAVRAWCVHGDERAAQWLVIAYRPLVRSIVQSLACPGQADDAEQETLVRAFAALHRYDPAQPFARWLGTIARNVLLNNFRSSNRYERMIARDGEAQALARPGSRSPDEMLIAKERLETVIGWLDSYEPRSSRIFRSHIFDGLSPDEVSDAEGLTAGAIRISIHRTRCDLRTRLASLS